MRTSTCPSLALLAIVPLLASCETDILRSPDAPADADCPERIDLAAGELLAAEGSGQGRANHPDSFRMGRAERATIRRCSLLEDPNPPLNPEDEEPSFEFEPLASDGGGRSGRHPDAHGRTLPLPEP